MYLVDIKTVYGQLDMLSLVRVIHPFGNETRSLCNCPEIDQTEIVQVAKDWTQAETYSKKMHF